jgi:hypothetical protein
MIQFTPRPHLVTINGRGDRNAASGTEGYPQPQSVVVLTVFERCSILHRLRRADLHNGTGGRPLPIQNRGCVMLGRTSPAVLMCANRAAECEVLAALADSPDTERYYLGLAKGWLAHGKDHAFTETVDSMLSGLRNEPEKDGDTDIQAITWRDIIRRCTRPAKSIGLGESLREHSRPVTRVCSF